MKNFTEMKRAGQRITALTAYDYPTARLLDESGIDIILVGDSVGMVVLGYEDTTRVTLAEMLHQHGYRTAAVVDNALLELDATARGLMRGFDSFYRNGLLDPNPQQQHWKTKTPADCITAQAIRWLKKRDTAQPFLLWLHYFDPHDPYSPPFADNMETLSRASGSELTGDIRNTFLFTAPKSPAALSLPEKDRQHLIDLYDAEIRYLDQSIADLVDFLKAQNLYRGSLIVLTADHGESFGEHGLWMHGQSLYDPEVHIPMVVKYPGQSAGERVKAPVQAIDLLPTVADVAHVSTAQVPIDGISLRRRASQPVFAFWGPWQLAENTEFKMVQHDGVAQLFRVATDPAEAHDLAADEPAVVNALAAAGKAIFTSSGDSAHQLKGVAPETIERMRALGYLSQ